jgi:dipeptidyl-peptidase-4
MEANEADVAEALKRLEDKPAAVTYPKPASRPSKLDQTGYLRRTAFGFTLYVSEECHDQSDRRDGQPIACLESELQAIAERLPEAVVKQLAKVPVWVEWDHAVPGKTDVLAVYHHASSQASLALTGVDARKNRCVTVMTLRTVYAAKSRDKLPTNVLAHELAHAVHDQLLGLDNPAVRNTFQQALTRRLYQDVRHADGQTGPAYALTNEAEYFAELSACYLDRIRYQPTDAAGLREYDSPGYELMTKVWGTEKAIEAAKKADADRKAKQRKPPVAQKGNK